MSSTFVLILLVLQTKQIQDAGLDLQILVPGIYHSGEVSAGSGKEWWGIFTDTSGFQLRKTTVSLNRTADVAGDEGGRKSGLEVVPHSTTSPVLLINAKARLTAGPIFSLFYGRIPITPNSSTELVFGYTGRFYSLRAKGLAERSGGGTNYRDFSITLFDGDRRQELFAAPTVSEDGIPSVLWVGDIDRDGKYDLLLDTRIDYGMTVYSLYLSSRAGSEELVKLVGQLRHVAD